MGMDVSSHEGLPPGAQCAEHPAEPASVLCTRCGSFACNACTRSEPPESLCAQCVEMPPQGADRGLRLLAHLVDVLAVCVPLGTAVAYGLRASTSWQGTVMFTAGATAALVTTVVSLVGIQRTGQSIGKRLFGLQVLQSDGSRASLGQVVWLRNVLPLLFALVPGLGLIFLLADPLFIFGRFGQCLHDRLADTIVVQRRS